MSGASSDPDDGSAKRSLPSWMSSKESGSKPRGKKRDDACDEASDQAKGKGRDNAQTDSRFSKLMEGVVFALSGLVNPERSTIRSHALEMGAEFRPDWTPDCTLLVCAFPNTPKFRQVAADCGTIVSKEWISECYIQKKLVDIESFLMHAGKPWRKSNNQIESNKGRKVASHDKPKKLPGRKSPEKLTEPAASKPETSEVKAIAAEGIITCLQDAIESLKENKDLRLVMEQWMFIPNVVKELVKLESGRNKEGSLSKEELRELALTCKKAYELEFDRLDNSPARSWKRKAGSNGEDDANGAGSDSDQTIEMTEEEIEIACKQLSS